MTWTAVVTADRAYYDQVRAADAADAASISFPVYVAERRFKLDAPIVHIGRRSRSIAIRPEIDLTGPPADPGVSRLHAQLTRAADGTWSVTDLGSGNGIQVNDQDVPSGTPIPLQPGDSIHLGAWTRITLTRARRKDDGGCRPRMSRQVNPVSSNGPWRLYPAPPPVDGAAGETRS